MNVWLYGNLLLIYMEVKEAIFKTIFKALCFQTTFIYNNILKMKSLKLSRCVPATMLQWTVRINLMENQCELSTFKTVSTSCQGGKPSSSLSRYASKWNVSMEKMCLWKCLWNSCLWKCLWNKECCCASIQIRQWKNVSMDWQLMN